MPLLTGADAVMVGSTVVDKVMFNGSLAWPLPVVDTNLAQNPRCGIDTTGWFYNAQDGVGSPSRETSGGPDANISTWYKVAIISAPTITTLYVHPIPTTTGSLPCFPGVMLPIGIWSIASIACSMFIRMYWYNSGGGSISNETQGAVNPPAGTWTRVQYNFTPPANAAFGRPLARFGGTFGVGSYMGVTGCLGGAAEPYFDGSTPDGGGYVYDWLGSEHASSSTRTG